MTARSAKQVIYGAFYLIVLAAIAGGVYFIFVRNSAPSGPVAACAGGANGAGGASGAGCVPSGAAGIIVGELYDFSSGAGSYTFLARVENHETGFAAKSFDYALELEDASGTVTEAFSGTSFLYDGEVKYIVVPNISAGAFDHASFVVENPDWVAARDFGPAPQFGNPLPVTGGNNGSGSGEITVAGTLEDGDPSAFSNITIVAILYGGNGAVVGASETELNAIAPGETEPFSVSYPAAAAPGVNPLLTQFYAYAARP